MLRLFSVLLLGFFLGLIGIGAFVYSDATKPLQLPEEGIVIKVEKGASARSIARQLEEAGIIHNAAIFRLAARLQKTEHRFLAGRYRFSGALSAVDVSRILAEGQTLTVTFSIPEGFNMWQIAERLDTKFSEWTKADFLAAFKDPELLAKLPNEASSAEGYLFPETYTISEDASPSIVAHTMVEHFFEKLTPEIKLSGKDKGLELHELVTLASIIEKETGAPAERGLISGVFHNRLRKGMKLQTDPTVIYGMWETYDGNIRKKDLQSPTPYNTYVINGLPPGPIASPGLDALEKAANPESTKALYFVARGDGSGLHDFSNSLEEHNRAVARYLRRLRKGINQ